ncbi:MAG TPA: VTT domain-containing protein [Deltaproteobacteria bacterium]|jgi:uncharacterized membrane protein YdjX (TVP38/TMEM64 family)|nr:VTT domain-containing protein [Deltaproteobacteria bacterium]HOI06483.1 VTT domain-containing protein [Deltaproteobacteria bacterium]
MRRVPGGFALWLGRHVCLLVLASAAFFALLALLRVMEPYPLKGWSELRDTLMGMGLLGPLAFVLLTAVLPLVSPLTILIVTGAASFGTAAGMALSYAGALLNANLTFLLVRALDIEEVWGTGERTARIRRTIRARGFHLVLLFQMVSVFPFVAINSAAAAAGIPWRDFMKATLLGVVPAVVIYSLVGEVVVSRFLPPDVYFAFILLVLLTIVVTALKERSARFRQRRPPSADR